MPFVPACGSIMTPLVLQQQGLGASSGQLGKNLSIHPACGALAEFEEQIRKAMNVPDADPAFVKKMRIELAKRPVKIKARSIFRPAWAIAIVLVLAVQWILGPRLSPRWRYALWLLVVALSFDTIRHLIRKR